jgi:hypothetical protein
MYADRHKLFAAYSVRNIKTFTGMEGPGFSATLCRDGRPVASVLNEAVGADFRFQWKSNAEEATLRDLCAKVTLPAVQGTDVAYDADMLICRLVDGHEDNKRLRRIAKEKTLFRLKGDAAGDWRTLNVVGPRAAQHLADKYGEQLETVYGQGARG